MSAERVPGDQAASGAGGDPGTARTAADRPAIVIVSRDATARQSMDGELAKRYGADYRIVVCAEPARLAALLAALRAIHLAKWASQVTVLVRGESLAQSMSDYLIRMIDAAPNVDVAYGVQIADGSGTDCLKSLVLADAGTGQRRTVPADALFVLIGSHPHTEWLGDTVARDQWGFIRTGPDLVGGEDAAWPLGRPPFPLETSLPGVFAAGDVRRASVKRCASAVGEGAVSIPQVHAWLETLAVAQAGPGH